MPKNFWRDLEVFLRIKKLAIRTKVLPVFEQVKFAGFVGRVIYNLDSQAPMYLGQILTMLSKWAIFTGVGAKRSYGCGAIDVLEK